jgi:sialate O-acetylesterase
MVLQQGKPIKVWGWAPAGAKVAVTLTQDATIGQPPKATEDDGAYSVSSQYVEKNPPRLATKTVTVDAAGGVWIAQFPPAKASFQPTWIIAKAGDQALAVQDALIGEIWVCAGQSNMGWGNFNRKDREAASADFPGLRYVAWHDSWYKPLDDIRNNVRWTPCTSKTAKDFSAVPYLYGMFLHRYLKVPVGIINVARGGTTGQTWCLRGELDNIDNVAIKTTLEDYDAITATWDDAKQVAQLMAEWEKACEAKKAEHAEKVAKAKADGKKEPRLRLPKPPADQRSGWSPPAGLFNATVLPIRHLGVRGVLYYQGENQAFNRWTRYEYTFPKIPVSFRKAFGDDTLPFGCISQPGWGTFGMDPEVATVRGGYQVVRDIQQRALKNDPHSGMIATYPTGNSYIHPGEKFPVAEYASLWALAKVYEKPVVHRANEYTGMKKADGKICLFFDSDPIVYERWKHIENNAYWQVLPCPREGNAEFKGFIIAGKEKRWYPAKAKHARVEGKPCIEVASDLVKEPVAVRYGWASWPDGNMVGRERLPLPVFRTDDWPLPVALSYSDEVKKATGEVLKQMLATAQTQALDRKIRQALVDVPALEKELHLRNGLKPLVQSKIERMAAVLDELEKDAWLSRQISGKPELAEKVKAARAAVEALEKQAEALEEK